MSVGVNDQEYNPGCFACGCRNLLANVNEGTGDDVLHTEEPVQIIGQVYDVAE